MLNISEELLKFGSIDMENLEQKIGRIPDDMKQAIELYNKALDDIVNKNEDIAIIALKKAISIYPAFYEAMNLMGICYLSLNEEENARIMFNKVIKMDNNSIRALNYLEELDGNTVPEGGKSKPVKVRKTNRAKTSSGESPSLVSWLRRGLALEHSQPYFIKYIVGFIIGVLVMCLVWLFTPSDKPIVFNLSKPINESLQMTELKNENADLAGRLDEATNALQKAKDTEKQLQDQMDQYAKWSAILRDLQNLADDGKYMEAVNEIEKNLAGLELPKEIEAEVIALNNECKPKAVQQFYDAAKKNL